MYELTSDLVQIRKIKPKHYVGTVKGLGYAYITAVGKTKKQTIQNTIDVFRINRKNIILAIEIFTNIKNSEGGNKDEENYNDEG